MRRWLWLCVLGLVIGCYGCGGGDSAAPGGSGGDDTTDGTDGGTPSALRGPGTAHFLVDVATGEVTVTPVSGSRAAFGGTAVGFHSSVLLDVAGSNGIRAVDVDLTNHWSVPIGRQADGTASGVRVVVGDITNVASPTVDFRTLTEVETAAGTGSAGTSDGPAATAGFNQPMGVVATDEGVVFVVEYANHRIRQIADGRVTTFAGSTTAGAADGLGTAARFQYPTAMAIDPDRTAGYVADYRTIRRVTHNGVVTTIAGTGASGGTDGPGNVATFGRPLGIAAGPNHTVYVTETAHRVRRLTLVGADPAVASSWLVETLAGNGTAGYADGTGSAARFDSPGGICAGADGVVYVADTNNHRIRAISAEGHVTTIAGTGIAGTSAGVGTSARFNAPFGICLVDQALFVADRDSARIRQLTLLTPDAATASASSWLVSTVAGTVPGDADGRGDVAALGGPRQLTVGPDGTLYAAEFDSHKVRAIRPSSGVFPIGSPTGTTSAESVEVSNPDGYIASCELGSKCPYFLYPAIDAGDTCDPLRWTFIVPAGVGAFEFRVQVDAGSAVAAPPAAVDGTSTGGVGSPDVMVSTLSGRPAGGHLDGVLHLAMYNFVDDMAVDRLGAVYLACIGDHTIRRIGTDGTVSTIAGIVESGSADGAGTVAEFQSPSGIAIAPAGNVIFVADSGNNTIRRMVLSGGSSSLPASWSVSTIAGVAGPAGYAEGIGGDARFNQPYACTLDAGGNLYVVERLGRRVRQVRFIGGDAASAMQYRVSLVAGDGGSVTPSAGSADGTGAAARFNFPRDIQAAPDGTLYVMDTGNNRIRKIVNAGASTSSVIVSTLIGGTTAGYLDGPAATARLNCSYGRIEVDPAGWIYFTDDQNQRVRRVSPSGVVSTVAGTGTLGLVDGPGNVAQFSYPVALGLSSGGDLYVSDGTLSSIIRLVQRVVDRE